MVSTLTREIQPLKYLFEGPNDCWAMLHVHYKEMEMSVLSRKLMRAFLFSMEDSQAREALKSLADKIITLLKLNLEAVITESSSPVSCFATSVKVKNLLQKNSSSASTSTSAEKSSSPETKQTPVTTRRVSFNPNIGDAYFSTSDVLIFHMPLLDKPMKVKLVVSVKKGCSDSAIADLITQLLSRLPYQGGNLIFGLHMNSIEATVCAVEHKLRNEDPLKPVNVCIWSPISFKKMSHPFSMESFWEMILDIGTILTNGTKYKPSYSKCR
ncbi:uncharacterized protein [Antedon mediterranea]|uniref:uncharacterized protein n=1 Tax=Antedon mediterranea TaxID=105859 RepID=UPI003AF5C9FA